MAYVFLIILLLIAFLAYKKSFDKGYLFSLLTMSLIVPNLAYVFASPLKYRTLSLFLCLLAFAVYYKKITKRTTYDKNIFKVYAAYFALSFCGVLMGELSLGYQVVRYAKYFFLMTLFPLFAWYTLTKNNSVNMFVKMLCFLSVFLSVYGIIEYVSKTNFYLDFISAALDDEFGTEFFMDNERGVLSGRISGFLGHPLEWGQNLFLVYAFLICLKRFVRNHALFYTTLALLFVNVVLSGSRSAIIPVVVVSLGLVEQQIRYHWKRMLLISPIILYIVAHLTLSEETLDTVHNFFFFWDQSGSVDTSMGGSSIEYRFEQLAIVLSTINQNPLFGMGYGFMETAHYERLQSFLNGSESIVLTQFMEHGIFGLFLLAAFYGALMALQMKWHKRVYKSWSLQIFLFHIAYFASLVFTGDRSSSIMYLAFVIMYCKCMSQLIIKGKRHEKFYYNRLRISILQQQKKQL